MRKLFYMVAAAMLAVPASADASVHATSSPWTQTWNAAIDHGVPVGPWTNQTLRMEETTSIGGTQLRIDLSNEFSTSPVTFAHVSVAQQLNGAKTAATPIAATFGGNTAVTLAAGAETTSDAVSFPTTPGERLLVSLYIPSTVSVPNANAHTYSNETEYNIVNQDGSMATNPPVNNVFGFTSYLNGLDVDAAAPQTVVAAGDSITDTGGTPIDTDTRWINYLGRRTGFAVVNEGISGNQVMQDLGAGGGPSLQHRWQHDVLNVPGVRTVIDEGGINDLRAGASAASLETAQQGLVNSAHTAGLRILLSTITPCSGASLCTPAFETQRQAYNAWVRAGTSGADAVVDFDAAVGAGAALNPMYDDGGHIHPNSAGMQSMGNAINTSQL
jgi:lysophospholipase L1-like esterase